jgi:hypothetical protein
MNDVPVEARQEQQLPHTHDLRFDNERPSERPLADQLEQELSVADVGELPAGINDDRVEALDDDDGFAAEIAGEVAGCGS